MKALRLAAAVIAALVGANSGLAGATAPPGVRNDPGCINDLGQVMKDPAAFHGRAVCAPARLVVAFERCRLYPSGHALEPDDSREPFFAPDRCEVDGRAVGATWRGARRRILEVFVRGRVDYRAVAECWTFAGEPSEGCIPPRPIALAEASITSRAR